MADEDDDGKYCGMFAGNRIGGMPTTKLNIIGEELNMLERGCRPLPFSNPPGPRLASPNSRARTDAANLRATQRPGTSLGFVGRMRGTVTKEAAFKRSGLDTNATRERLFGTTHSSSSAKERFSTSYKDAFKFFEGADEMSLYSTMRKSKSQPLIETPQAMNTSLKRASSSQSLRQRRTSKNPFDLCPAWETTSMTLKGNWDMRDGRYRRIKPAVQMMNPLMAAD